MNEEYSTDIDIDDLFDDEEDNGWDDDPDEWLDDDDMDILDDYEDNFEEYGDVWQIIGVDIFNNSIMQCPGLIPRSQSPIRQPI